MQSGCPDDAANTCQLGPSDVLSDANVAVDKQLLQLFSVNRFLLDEKIRTECPLLGKRVQITGASRDDLNGRAGVATSFDHARGRYVVELEGKGKSNKPNTKTKVKPDNPVQTGANRKGKK